ncbi:MAG TPA: hypothetical protein VF444_17905 [Pseudonocardiaceae bacterium]
MTAPLANALIIASLVGALWSVVLMMLSRPIGKIYLLGYLALIEIGLLVLAVLAVVALFLPHGPVRVAVFVGYLIGSLVILPLAGWWSVAERSRWGMGVLLIGCLAIPVMIVRMYQLWSGGA